MCGSTIMYEFLKENTDDDSEIFETNAINEDHENDKSVVFEIGNDCVEDSKEDNKEVETNNPLLSLETVFTPHKIQLPLPKTESLPKLTYDVDTNFDDNNITNNDETNILTKIYNELQEIKKDINILKKQNKTMNEKLDLTKMRCM